MAITLAPKAPTGTARYTWKPDLDAGDYLASASVAVTSGTLTLGRSGVDNGEVFFFVSGGVADETPVVIVTATTTAGAVIVETFSVPIRTTEAKLGVSVAEVLSYALRPVVGIGNVADADETEDAREALDLMLASWAMRGADLGVRLPVDVSDVLAIPDAYVMAVKANLRVMVCEIYGKEPSRTDRLHAVQGMILVTHTGLPEHRQSEYF